MFDNSARVAKEVVLTPVAGVLDRVHPITVTAVSLVLGIICAIFAWQQLYGASIIFWLLNRLTDGLDGTVARVHRKQSDLGGYVDILTDFAIYTAVPIALVMGAPSLNRYLALAFLLATYYINGASWMYLAAILEKRQHGAKHNKEKTSVTMPVAIIGGLETILVYLVFLIWYEQMILWFVTMGILVLVCVGQRLVWAVRHLGED